MKKNKKMTAAVAAVMGYLKNEEETVIAASMTQGAPLEPPELPKMPQMNLWGLSGRQSMMQMRGMMQLKAFHGVKFR